MFSSNEEVTINKKKFTVKTYNEWFLARKDKDCLNTSFRSKVIKIKDSKFIITEDGFLLI